MFGFFKKPCEHEHRAYTQISLTECFETIDAEKISGEVERPVYFCMDCRVLFVPREEEKMKIHERQKND